MVSFYGLRNVPNPTGWAIRVVAVLLSVFFRQMHGSVPMVVGSLCRSEWGLALSRCGISLSLVALCLAKILPFRLIQCCYRARKVKPYGLER